MSTPVEPPALVSTVHDPAGRLLQAITARGHHLTGYAGCYLCVTDATPPPVVGAWRARGAQVAGNSDPGIGTARRLALRAAFDAGHSTFLYCDADRWLHWTGRYPDELAALPARLAGRRPRAWYACLGRTARAFATHPYVQRLAERATNHAFSLAVGRRIDATAGACWLSREGAELVLRESREPTNANDLEWPAIVHRADPRRLTCVLTEGLEFETAGFFGPEIEAMGGEAAWVRARYERLQVWLARLQLATDSVRVAQGVLRRET